MIPWSEIRRNAVEFVTEWRAEKREAEARTFWDQFFKVFGFNRRRLASFEVPIKFLDGKRGRIDLYWKGTLLAEHKSRGENLDAAYVQATDYFEGIPEEDHPKHIVVSDFARFRIYDRRAGDAYHEFAIEDFPKHIERFAFVLGQIPREYEDAPPINIKAAGLMAKLHDALKANRYEGKDLEIFLVRIMFCLFADYTGIFARKNDFRYYIETKTKANGSDLGIHLREIFEVLNKPIQERQIDLDPDLAVFPHVNGHLFEESIKAPSFKAETREILLQCCAFDWSEVSPAIFGTLFQLAMNRDLRAKLGGHYTSEKNILKAIRALLVDPLRADLGKIATESDLNAMLDKIAKVKVLDPACGCGSFLIIAYRELRQLEIDIHAKLVALHRQQVLTVDFTQGIDVDSMYGIDIDELPVRIAETALYLVDHQMNMKASLQFGNYYTRLPLKKSPHLKKRNALDYDWAELVKPEELTCIVGNPPFLGKKKRTPEQNADMRTVFGSWKNHGELDYVSCWYVKALSYIQGTKVRCALVATNSITQGEQVGILWKTLVSRGLRIHFAHRTFRWTNDAPNVASVFCVIVGFAAFEPTSRFLYDYQNPDSDPVEARPTRINPYLVDADDVFVESRRTSICSSAPTIRFGNMPNDGQNLLLEDDEKKALLASEPGAALYIRRFLSDKKFLQNIPRWCLWLDGVAPSKINALPEVRKRVEAVKAYREASGRAETRRLAETPYLFGEIRQPGSRYILIPRHTSEHRRCIPIAICEPVDIVADSCAAVYSEDLYVLGVLMSAMHMAWVRQVCGRIKSDFRYSNEIVYNNFPWPKAPTEAKQANVRIAAQSVLASRLKYPDESLEDLYDPVSMPSELTAAHRVLDRAVDSCYRTSTFTTEAIRLRYLFELYEAYAADGQMSLPQPKKRTPKVPSALSKEPKGKVGHPPKRSGE